MNNIKNYNSGIYQIVNLTNNKRYIGSSIDLKYRKQNHFNKLKKQKHINAYLQKAYNKYGENNFKFEILLYCSKQNLLFYEQRIINAYDFKNELYNLSPTAGNSLGVKFSEETKKKIGYLASIRYKGKNNPFYGKKHSEETKQKLRDANTGKTISDETRIKISIAGKGRDKGKKHSIEQNLKQSTPVNVYSYKTNQFIGSFESQKKAAEFLNISPSHIPAVLSKSRKQHCGYVFKPKKDEI